MPSLCSMCRGRMIMLLCTQRATEKPQCERHSGAKRAVHWRSSRELHTGRLGISKQLWTGQGALHRIGAGVAVPGP